MNADPDELLQEEGPPFDEDPGERVKGANGLDEAPPDPLGAIRAEILADLNAGPAAIDAALPPRFIQYPHLPECGANMCAPGETGKTALALTEKIRVACGMPLYPFAEVQTQGPCVLVTAEDGADRARYVLQRALADGIASGQLTEAAARGAKEHIRIIGWRSSTYGRIVKVDAKSGEMYRAPVFDLLLELLTAIKPVYVTLDPETLFAPGERYGNDGHAFTAALLHETAMSREACVQMLDHVSQSVARTGIVDQYSARGGTAKSDEARLVRQLVTVTALAEDEPAPLTVTRDEVAKGNVLRLHWTKLSWAPKWKTGTPVWLRRRGYWFETLRLPSGAEHAEQAQSQATERSSEELKANVTAVVEFVRAKLTTGKGTRMSARDVTRADPGPMRQGKAIARDRIRTAIGEALSAGELRYLDLPKDERQGQRKQYLAPADFQPPESTP